MLSATAAIVGSLSTTERAYFLKMAEHCHYCAEAHVMDSDYAEALSWVWLLRWTGAMAEREQMTDEWLRSAFDRARFVGSNRGGDEDEQVNDILRGFANRVLQQFGDRQGMADALDIAYTKHKAAQAARGVRACAPGECRTPAAPCRGACIQTGQPRDTTDEPRPCGVTASDSKTKPPTGTHG